jgi:hemoglobin/transferrin/lactoferrin receptor protein
MKLQALLLVMWMALSTLQGQIIQVIDHTTRQAIPGVIIYNANKLSITTNNKGFADLGLFKNDDTLRFRQYGYEELAVARTVWSVSRVIELQPTVISKGEVVISANRWENEKQEVPNKIEKISMREAQLQNPQTAADLVGSSGYVYIQKSQLAGGSPMIRGFATNRVMIVVDGVRMNNAIFRGGNVQNIISLDAGGLESAEVLFGPGAVMYGSDAIGGVMDFQTLAPKFATDSGNYFSANAMTRYSSANNEKTGHVDFVAGFKKWSFVTGFTFSEYDDLRAGSKGDTFYLRPFYQQTFGFTDSIVVNNDPSLQVNSGYSQYNVVQKIAFRPDSNWLFDYAFHYSQTSDAPRYDRLIADNNNNGVLDFAQWYYGPQKWMMNRAGISHSKPNRFYNHARLIVAQQAYQESRHDRRFGNKKLRHQTENVTIYSANLDLDKKWNERLSSYYGGEYVFNRVNSEAYREHIETGVIDPPINTRYPNGSTWQSIGVYHNLRYRVNEKNHINWGMRYSHNIIQARFDSTLFPYPYVSSTLSNGSLNGSLGWVHSHSESFEWYANVSTGFRAPNIDDIGKVFDSQPGTIVVPNPDLKPEYAYNAELGFTKIFGQWMKMEFAAYYTYLDNALARRQFQVNGADSMLYDGVMSQIFAIQNISYAQIYGAQIGLDFSLGKGFAVRSTFNYIAGQEFNTDSAGFYPPTHNTPSFGALHFRYERKGWMLDLNSQFNVGMRYEDFALSERLESITYLTDANGLPYTPGWYTINFKAGYYWNKYLSIHGGVENIMDVLYRPYGSGISAPGRNFIISFRVKV